MVLEANVTFALEVFERGLEFVFCAVGILFGLGPAVEVHVDDLLTVELDFQCRALDGDDQVVPAISAGIFGRRL